MNFLLILFTEMNFTVSQTIAHFILLTMEIQVNYQNKMLRKMFGNYEKAKECYTHNNIHEYTQLIDEIIEYGQKRRLYAGTCKYTKIGSKYRIEISFIPGLVVKVDELNRPIFINLVDIS